MSGLAGADSAACRVGECRHVDGTGTQEGYNAVLLACLMTDCLSRGGGTGRALWPNNHRMMQRARPHHFAMQWWCLLLHSGWLGGGCRAGLSCMAMLGWGLLLVNGLLHQGGGYRAGLSCSCLCLPCACHQMRLEWGDAGGQNRC